MASSVSAARTLGLRIWCAAYMPAPWVMGPARQTSWLGQGDSETLGLVFPMMILTASDGVESEHVAWCTIKTLKEHGPARRAVFIQSSFEPTLTHILSLLRAACLHLHLAASHSVFAFQAVCMLGSGLGLYACQCSVRSLAELQLCLLALTSCGCGNITIKHLTGILPKCFRVLADCKRPVVLWPAWTVTHTCMPLCAVESVAISLLVDTPGASVNLPTSRPYSTHVFFATLRWSFSLNSRHHRDIATTGGRDLALWKTMNLRLRMSEETIE